MEEGRQMLRHGMPAVLVTLSPRPVSGIFTAGAEIYSLSGGFMAAEHVQRVIILGAAGRDFHDFNTTFRDNDRYEREPRW